MPSCPTCGHCTPDAEPVLSAEDLRATCVERGIWIAPDSKVREADAAMLLGLQPKTLRNRRYAGADLPFVMRAGRPLYALSDLAEWLERA